MSLRGALYNAPNAPRSSTPLQLPCKRKGMHEEGGQAHHCNFNEYTITRKHFPQHCFGAVFGNVANKQLDSVRRAAWRGLCAARARHIIRYRLHHLVWRCRHSISQSATIAVARAAAAKKAPSTTSRRHLPGRGFWERVPPYRGVLWRGSCSWQNLRCRRPDMCLVRRSTRGGLAKGRALLHAVAQKEWLENISICCCNNCCRCCIETFRSLHAGQTLEGAEAHTALQSSHTCEQSSAEAHCEQQNACIACPVHSHVPTCSKNRPALAMTLALAAPCPDSGLYHADCPRRPALHLHNSLPQSKFRNGDGLGGQ